MSYQPPPTPPEQVAAAAAVEQRVRCHACYRGWPKLVPCPIPPYGVVSACEDPVSCRRHAIRAGIYKLTDPAAWRRQLGMVEL
jgi:hypothetical protein